MCTRLHYSCFALICAVLLLSACSLKEDERASAVMLRSFRAKLPENFEPGDPVGGDVTRSSVTLATGASAFIAGDRALVTDGSTEAIYKYDGSAFQYESGTEPADISAAVAFFPASLVTGRDGKSLQVSLPASQARKTETLNDLPMFGKFYGDASVCHFYNLCTILKVSAGDGAATSGKTLSGLTFDSHEAGITGAAIFSDGNLTMAAGAGKSLAVTGSPASLGASTDWYLILPSQSYPGGFEMTLSFTDGKTYTYATNRTVVLMPGYISAMEAFSCTDFSGGSGTQANPYRIASQADWVALQAKISTAATTDAYRDKYYVLTADIDFAGGSLATIGTEDSQAFTGCFDGDGHTLSNLTLARSTDAERCALFGSLDGGTLKNLSFVNVATQGTRTANYSAILAAKAVNGSLIENCTVTGATIASGKPYVGVATGYLDASTVRNCTATGITVSGTRTSDDFGVGGLVGRILNSCTVSNCSVSGSVSSSGNNVGGVIGLANGGTSRHLIENCHFTGSISGHSSVGGIISDMSSQTTIRGCSVTIPSGKAISAQGPNIAGIVAFINTSASQDGIIEDCSFSGKITNTYGDRVAGIAGNDGGIGIGVPVRNCRVENATITGKGIQTAGIVARLVGQTIQGCSIVSSSITGPRVIGGIVADASATSGSGCQVKDCSVENTSILGTKTNLVRNPESGSPSDYAYVGGVVGLIQNSGDSPLASRIVRCHASGSSVKSPGKGVGGIAGVIGIGGASALVDECWSNDEICSLNSEADETDSGHYHSGMVGGIVGQIAEGSTGNLVINCSYYGNSVSSEGPHWGAAGGIVGLMVYEYAVGAVTDNAVINCFSNPTSVTAGGNLGAGGIGGDMCRYIVDNCYSPIDSDHLAVGTNHTNTTASLMGRVNRGGRVVNCYYTYESSTTRQQRSATDWTYEATALTDADMRAAAASVTIPSTGNNAASLTDALNTGADLYNNGGDGVAHHGTLPYSVRAKSWALGSYGYPTIVGSPICDADPEDYARTLILDDPNLIFFLPPRKSSNGKMVILIPGGGYHFLSDASGGEGEGWAPYYNKMGFSCAVLRYTLPAGHPERPLGDLEKAFQYVKDHAAALHINALGVHGFSAGGHLASTAATHFTGGMRPDFQILFSPVITMGANAHANSRKYFLGDNPSAEMVTLYSNELQVTASTPKAFVWYYDSDSVVNPSYNAIQYINALGRADISCTVEHGAGTTHGYPTSLKEDNSTFTTWLKAL